MFARPILTAYSDVAELVGLHDVNPLRVKAAQDLLGRPDVPAFDSFGSMLERTRPDTVIVASKDSTHRAFIVEAMRSGCDVITEKPMTINDASCREILTAERETGRDLRVAFNYRYAPYFTKAKELLAGGTIGDVRSVDFHWYLDTDHGADYFRRWHRKMENSGGLFRPQGNPSLRPRELVARLAEIAAGSFRPTADGRAMAMEILIPNSAIRNLIREDKIHQIYSTMQTGQGKFGMQTFNQSLAHLVLTRQISRDDALAKSSSPEELHALIQRGVGVNLVPAGTRASRPEPVGNFGR